jgi:hypothetical protein
MGKVWVQAIGRIYYEKGGIQEVVQPGDWAEIGRHQARMLLARGIVKIPRADRHVMTVDHACSGIVARAPTIPEIDLDAKLQVTCGVPDTTFNFTMIWEPSLPVTTRVVELGLSRCRESEAEGWEVLAILTNILAADVGDNEEQAKTKQMVKDLRTPVYEPRLLWIRRTSSTEKFVGLWADELASGADEHHALLRSLYQSKVTIRALPTNWLSLQVPWRPHA